MTSSAAGSAVTRAAVELLGRIRDEAGQLRIPASTYRIQLHRHFNFREATGVLPYLARLGISDLYASPYLKATPGSVHGYDVIDHRRLNPEVGDEDDHRAFCATLAKLGLGQLLDFVPNHMGIERLNPLWDDVLENGPSAEFAKVFDIDWDPVKAELKNKVLLPILGDQYGEVLERGELKLVFEAGAFHIAYFQHRLPIAPKAYRLILHHRIDELRQAVGEKDADFVELLSVLTALEHLPTRADISLALIAERSREKEVIKRRLAGCGWRSEPVRRFIEANVVEFNGVVGEPRSFDRLEQVLSACSFRLAHWRVAGEEINYRRFFDINTLAAIRVEDPEVFELVHRQVLEWLGEGRVTGLRIDHPDGLFDPTAYFLNLQEQYVLERARRLWNRSQPPWEEVGPQLREAFRREVHEHPDSPLRKALYVVIEKIQGGRERIPEGWAVHGTTGYRFANAAAGVLVDRSNERMMTEVYEQFVGRPMPFGPLLYEKKKLVLNASMSSELNVLARELNRISEMNRRSRDFTLGTLRQALVEFVALFPVYRTYLDAWRPQLDERDVRYIDWTIAQASVRDPTTNVSIFRFLRAILLRQYPEHTGPEEREVMLRFAMKLQQVTGPVMAKALEDTTFYVYNRLLSLNEVGGEPERFGTSVETFHLRNQERVEAWPGSLLTSSTHDTKRSEDVRCRLHVLSEVPEAWAACVRRWSELHRPHRQRMEGITAPSPNDEYHFYQTVVGVWPMGEDLSGTTVAQVSQRIADYWLKALREGKENTSWLNPHHGYEQATLAFAKACFHSSTSDAFVRDMMGFKRRIERAGQLNSLSLNLLKLGSPGVADVYQGCELWDLSLVDPDNRRPVDFGLRERLLGANDREAALGREALCLRLWRAPTDGRVKLYVLSEALRLRRRAARLFSSGSYVPLDAEGERAEHVVGFARRLGPQRAVVAVPRLTVGWVEEGGPVFRGTQLLLPGDWSEVALTDIYTGRVLKAQPHPRGAALPLDELWAFFPVALLYKAEE